MGEARKDALRVDFDHSVKLEFHGSTVSSDGGLLAYRELDEAFGLTAMADHALRDLRDGREALDTDDAAGEAYQDRGEGRPSRAVRDLPDGGGGRVTEGLCRDPRPDISVGRQGAGRADCGVRVRGEAPFQPCTHRSRGASGTGIGMGKQRLKVNLGYPEAIGTLTEALPTPENRQIGLFGGAVRPYHGAVRPGTVPGQGPTGKSRMRCLPQARTVK